jgi:hypothetical protein
VRPWILVIVLLGVASAQQDNSVDAAFDRLAHVDRFAFGGIGYAGVTSEGEKDFRLILARRTALADFERLLSVGNSQAKLYALAGIRKLSPGRFEVLSRPFGGSKEKVMTQSGCIVWHDTLATVLKQIMAGQYSR